jgi:hypothetical protein
MKVGIYSAVFVIISVLFAGCTKDADRITVEEMLKEKDWFLERRKTNQSDYFFVGLPTFSFQLAASGTYNDTDGITGQYAISRSGTAIVLTVTATGRTISAYTVKNVGIKHLVLEFGSGTTQSTLYFSARQ